MTSLLSVTQSPNTSSRPCDKVVLQDLKSPGFLGCLSCKLIAIRCTNFTPPSFSSAISNTEFSEFQLFASLLIFMPKFCLLTYLNILRHDFQFFNTQRLSELYEKEVRCLMVGYASGFPRISFIDIFVCAFLFGILIFRFISANAPEESIKRHNRSGRAWRYNSFFLLKEFFSL